MRLKRRPCRVPPNHCREAFRSRKAFPPTVLPLSGPGVEGAAHQPVETGLSPKSSAGCNGSSLVWGRKLSRVQLAPGVLRIKAGTSAPKADSRRLGGPQTATPKFSYVERSDKGDRENLERRNIKSCCLPANSQSAYGKRWVVPTNSFYRKPD